MAKINVAAAQYLGNKQPKALPVPKWFKALSGVVAALTVITALCLEPQTANSTENANQFMQDYYVQYQLTEYQQSELKEYLSYWASINPELSSDITELKHTAEIWRRTR